MLPGLAIGAALGAIEARPLARPFMALATALVIATGVLPILDSLAARVLGLTPTLAFHLLLCAAGATMLRGSGVKMPSRGWCLAGLAWLAVLAYAWIDFDWNGRLHQSLLIKDMVKHAATVRSMVDTGFAPPQDVFFVRESPAGYYYYYYVFSALVELAGFGFIDSRAAVGGQVFWTGLALFALAALLLDRLAPSPRLGAPRARALAVIMTAAGIEIVVVVLVGALIGMWPAQVAWWKEAVGGFVHSILWVPHHLAAVIATWVGLLALSR